MHDHFVRYQNKLVNVLGGYNWAGVETLAETLYSAWQEGKQVFLCGNGGSAGNAIHLANDLLYGISKNNKLGIRVEALPANPSVLTCLANDIDYSEIFAQQVRVKGRSGDVMIALSGSGNSPNVIRALEVSSKLNLTTFAILGYSGGKCKNIADTSIHFPIDDMQIAEDLQLIVGHMCMQWLSKKIGEQ